MNQLVQNALKVALVVSTLGQLSFVSHAELPPAVYQEMRNQASELLSIEITKVIVSKRRGKELVKVRKYNSVEVIDRVVSVRRSTSKLKVGDTISLGYTTFVMPSGMIGPSSMPMVQAGKFYRAWLKKSGSSFRGAAGGQSLELELEEKTKAKWEGSVYIIHYDQGAFVNGKNKNGETLEQLVQRHAREFHGKILYIYEHASFGCSMSLTGADAAKFSQQPEVLLLTKEQVLHTTSQTQ